MPVCVHACEIMPGAAGACLVGSMPTASRPHADQHMHSRHELHFAHPLSHCTAARQPSYPNSSHAHMKPLLLPCCCCCPAACCPACPAAQDQGQEEPGAAGRRQGGQGRAAHDQKQGECGAQQAQAAAAHHAAGAGERAAARAGGGPHEPGASRGGLALLSGVGAVGGVLGAKRRG